MEISKNFSRYDTAIQTNQDIQQSRQALKTNSIKSLLEAFRIDLSPKALASSEINDPSISFPTHNADVLQYNENLALTFKP